jgi:LPXTG-site transpeptidase (sortase) family protein
VLAGCGSGGHATTVAPPARPAAHAAAAASTTVLPPRVVPVSVRIPKIGATSTLVGLGLNPDGTVQVPPVHTPMQAGWYDRGYPPGEDGPAVLLGHVDGDHQAGIFYRLHELAAGDKVLVTRQDGSVLTFTVTHTQKVDKDAFPTNAVYGPTSDPELRLVTCGGAFDYSTYHYVDNLIVYASLS